MKTFNELKSIFMELYKTHGFIYKGYDVIDGDSEFNSTEGRFIETHYFDNSFIVWMKVESGIKSIRLTESFICKNLFDTEVSGMVIKVFGDCVTFGFSKLKGTKYNAQFANFYYVVPVSNSDEFAKHFQKCYDLCNLIENDGSCGIS